MNRRSFLSRLTLTAIAATTGVRLCTERVLGATAVPPLKFDPINYVGEFTWVVIEYPAGTPAPGWPCTL